MKQFKPILILATFSVMLGCASLHNNVSTPITTPSEVTVLDPLAKILTSSTFVAHAKKSLEIAGTTDPIFTSCIGFQLALGEELKAKPLIILPEPILLHTDPTCPLCLLAAKRKDIETIRSGSMLAQGAETKARARDIQKRAAMACAPLLTDEAAVLNKLLFMLQGQ